MKILLVADLSVVHSRRYLDLIQMAGCDVAVIDTGRAAKPGSGRVEQYYHWPWSGRSVLQYFLGASLALRVGEFLVRLQLKRLLAHVQRDITHVQWIDDKAWMLADMGVHPLVLTAWGTDLNMTRDPTCDPVQRQRKGEAISKAALLVADSQDMIRLAEDLASHPPQSLLLPIGIDTKLFKPGLRSEALEWRRRLNIPDAAKVVLSPRAFRENYGHESIARAFGQAISGAGVDAYLVFKSYDCWDRTYIDTVTSAASASGVADRIRIVDQVTYEQLPVFYAMGDFAVNCVWVDAFPVTFLECLACELPVLTIHRPAYDSLGVAPYLRFTDEPTEAAIARGIVAMLSSGDSSRRNMSEARKYVSTNFDETAIASDLARAYDRIMDSSNANSGFRLERK